MRFLFPLFLLFTLCVKAQQDSCSLRSTVDTYTKERQLSTGFIKLEGASLTIDATRQEVDIFFIVQGNDQCFAATSTATIFFAGTKLKMNQRNNGTMNCEGFFHFVNRNLKTPPFVLRRLATLKVDRIVFVGNEKKETTITLIPEQQEMLMKFAGCMVNAAPALLP